MLNIRSPSLTKGQKDLPFQTLFGLFFLPLPTQKTARYFFY